MLVYQRVHGDTLRCNNKYMGNHVEKLWNGAFQGQETSWIWLLTVGFKKMWQTKLMKQ